jgi:predicted DNA-binding transcriptional regulator AlpA
MQNALKVAHDFIVATYPGRAFVELNESCHALNIATKTGYHWIAAGIFPLPIMRLGGKIVIPVPALEAYLADRFALAMLSAPAEPVSPDAPPKRGRGRPRKNAQATGSQQ